MKRIFTLLFAVLSCGAAAFAKDLDCFLDFAQFRHDDGKTQWELYYSFPDTAPQYVRQDNGTYLGSMYCIVEIASPTLIQPVTKEWIVDNSVAKPVISHTQNLVGTKSFVLAAGDYTVRFVLYDLNDTTSGAEITFPIVVRRFPDNRLALSDLQLVSSVAPHTAAGERAHPAQFMKNGFYITPNPTKEYIGSPPTLALYVELYNAKKYLRDSILADYRILDAAKRQVFRQTFRRATAADLQAETAQFPLTSLPSGLYYASLAVQSTGGGADTVSVMEKFYVLNPAIPPKMRSPYTEDEQFQASEFATLSPERTEEEFQKAKYLANRQELDLYAGLDETLAKQKFLYRFWKGRDPDPETTFNEKLEEFRENVRYADQNFANLRSKQGWKTDKGRILLKYGKPSQIDRYYTVTDTRPYEIWFYSHLSGGIEFSFVDMTGNGQFVLVHSTALGELRNDDWINRYVRNAGTGDGVDLPSTPR